MSPVYSNVFIDQLTQTLQRCKVEISAQNYFNPIKASYLGAPHGRGGGGGI